MVQMYISSNGLAQEYGQGIKHVKHDRMNLLSSSRQVIGILLIMIEYDDRIRSLQIIHKMSLFRQDFLGLSWGHSWDFPRDILGSFSGALELTSVFVSLDKYISHNLRLVEMLYVV